MFTNLAQSPAMIRLLLRVRPQPLVSTLKRLLGVKRRVVTTAQGTFYVDPVSGFGHSLIAVGAYEPGMVQVLRKYLTGGATFVDVGANEGYHSVVASTIVGPSGRVIAIEPQSRLLPVLSKNLEMNKCPNVTVVRSAVSDRKGSANLYLYPSTNPGASSLTCPTKYPLPSEHVETATLNEIFVETHLLSCDLLKVDVEGSEHQVIFGSEHLFRSRLIRALALEPSESLATRSTREIESFLQACGYRLDLSFPSTARRSVWYCAGS
jgi:FkbM family methyltransferase